MIYLIFPKLKKCCWYKDIKDGREDVYDEHRSGRPTTSKTEENIIDISFGSIQS